MSKTTTNSSPGSVLLKARRAQRIKRVELAERLHVPDALLKAFDEWNFSQLPQHNEPVHVALRRYARAVGVPFAALEPDMPREYQPKQHQSYRPKSWFLVSKVGVIGLAAVVVAAFAAFIAWRTLSATAIPELSVEYPEPAWVTAASKTSVGGTTNEGSQVFVNGVPVPVESDGRFEGEVVLQDGPNLVEIKALNRLGREHIIERLIIRQ